MIEGANGRRVKLDLFSLSEFAVFPGQIVSGLKNQSFVMSCPLRYIITGEANIERKQNGWNQVQLLEKNTYFGVSCHVHAQVVVEGHNVTGDCIKVISLHCDSSLPMHKTPASQIAVFNETEDYLGGLPLSVMVAAGPYTTRYATALDLPLAHALALALAHALVPQPFHVPG
jgi:hypothetical protein